MMQMLCFDCCGLVARVYGLALSQIHNVRGIGALAASIVLICTGVSAHSPFAWGGCTSADVY